MSLSTITQLPFFKEVKDMTREEWLNLVCEKFLWPLIQQHGGKRPPRVRLSVGFPKGSRGGKHAIGQCWDTTASADDSYEIFSSPEQGPEQTIETLLHELIHASVGIKAKHGSAFKQLALAVGFEAPMKSTPPSKELRASIQEWISKLPPFPGARMDISKMGKAKPGSRLIKVYCPSCDYTMRITQKWIETGVPACPNVSCEDFDEGKIMQVEAA